MSGWEILHKPAFTADLLDLNKNLQRLIIRGLEELAVDPMAPRGDTIKPLKGYKNVWRYRVGGHRMIYAVAPTANLVQLLAVGPRSNVYERFNYDGWDAPGAAVEFGPEMAAEPEWMKHKEWFQPKEKKPEKGRLPRKLTPALLKKWQIDQQYHTTFMRCLYDEDLVRLIDKEIPSDVLERVWDGLYPAEVERIANQPDRVLLKPEDLASFADGTLTSFLLKLDDQQQPIVNWALKGPTLVKGGPGSGKSTVALYRLRTIIEHSLTVSGDLPDILFTTYTNALVNTSTSLVKQLLRDLLEVDIAKELPPQIKVTTLHKIAFGIVRSSGKRFTIASSSDCRNALRDARASLQPKGLGDANKLAIAASLNLLRDDYLLEEFDWIVEGQNCESLDDYLAAHRAGRGIPFNQSTRKAVWQLYRAYIEDLLSQNKYTWGYLIQEALRQARFGESYLHWDYVIVDEAQDLPPAAVALCIELCREPTGLFLTADANQSLYNRGFRWTNVHADLNVTGRTRILRCNYRSTREIATGAAQILQPVDGCDLDTTAQEYVHAGAPPVIYAAEGSVDQAKWIAQQIYDAAWELRLPINSAVVLVPTTSVGQPLADALRKENLPAKFMQSNRFELEDPCIKVTTLHAAKGLEFPIVVVAHVEAGRLPREIDATDPEELEIFLEEQRRLFYVGCTRAMRYLFVTHDRQLPSAFLAELTDDYWMKL